MVSSSLIEPSYWRGGIIVLACLCIVAFWTGSAHAVKSAKQPRTKTSILLILTDDLGFGDVEYNRPENAKWNGALTPNLNQMSKADTAFHFDNFHSASSVCSPTRASILSGRYADRDCVSGANAKYDLPGRDYRETFPFRINMPSIARTAKNVGYRTAFFGKWHLGPLKTKHPGMMGFDNWVAAEGNLPTYDPSCLITEAKCQAACAPAKVKHVPGECIRVGKQRCSAKETSKNCYLGHYGNPWNFSPAWSPLMYTQSMNESAVVPVQIPEKQMPCDFVVDLFDNFIKSVRADDPFFTFLWFNEPHHPFIASPEMAQRCLDGVVCKQKKAKLSEETDYFAVVAAIDMAVGRVRNILRRENRAADTLLIFTSDNGPERASGDGAGTPFPFRASKGNIFEGSYRVPTIMEWPLKITQNAVVNGLASSLDFRATFNDLFRLEGASENQLEQDNERSVIDGISLIPLFSTPQQWQRPVPFGLCRPVQVKRRMCDTFSIINGTWKIVSTRRKTTAQYNRHKMTLYNMQQDQTEGVNVAGKHPQVYNEMMHRAVAWVQDVMKDYNANCGKKKSR